MRAPDSDDDDDDDDDDEDEKKKKDGEMIFLHTTSQKCERISWNGQMMTMIRTTTRMMMILRTRNLQRRRPRYARQARVSAYLYDVFQFGAA